MSLLACDSLWQYVPQDILYYAYLLIHTRAHTHTQIKSERVCVCVWDFIKMLKDEHGIKCKLVREEFFLDIQ